MGTRHLVSVADLDSDTLIRILESALEMKQKTSEPLLQGQTMAMLFEKPSLRTKVSFDVAMYQLGGRALYLSDEEVALGRREPIKDAVQVLSRYVNIIVARTFSHITIEFLARYSIVPVINALSDMEHPCQAISDLLTVYEKKGTLKDLIVAYVGDGNNVAASLMLACALAGIEFRFASPANYGISNEVLEVRNNVFTDDAKLLITENPEMAASGADVVYTDVWTSMGQESEKGKRKKDFANYRITPELLAVAKPDALLMHPMPVHHGEELAEGLIDCPQSVLIDQAENRLHAQKAILVELLK